MSTLETSKGQVTIPTNVRGHLDIAPGTAVRFEPTADGRAVRTKVSHARPDRRESAAGSPRCAGAAVFPGVRLAVDIGDVQWDSTIGLAVLASLPVVTLGG